MKIIFQGDSITDANRNRCLFEGLGNGYVKFVALKLKESGCKFLNKAIAGDRVADMLARWDKDVIQETPNIVTVLIGINDILSKNGIIATRNGDAFDKFEENMRKVFERNKQALSNCQMIVMSPFLLRTVFTEADILNDLETVKKLLSKLCEEYSATYIDLDELFCVGCKIYRPRTLSKDGIHPTKTGAKLIANDLAFKLVKLIEK